MVALGSYSLVALSSMYNFDDVIKYWLPVLAHIHTYMTMLSTSNYNAVSENSGALRGKPATLKDSMVKGMYRLLSLRFENNKTVQTLLM